MAGQRASKRQRELLLFVDGFIKGNGYGPSYREVMRALGYKSVSTVATHIDSLISGGYLVKRDHSARSLEVLTLQDEALPAAGVKDDAVHIDWLVHQANRRLKQKVITEHNEAEAKVLLAALQVVASEEQYAPIEALLEQRQHSEKTA